MVQLILQLSRAFLRDARARRTLMFYGVIIALVLLFIGATFLDDWPREHPVWFVGYWAVCAWLTLAVVLLATFDMLVLRAAARKERQRLARQVLHDDLESGR